MYKKVGNVGEEHKELHIFTYKDGTINIDTSSMEYTDAYYSVDEAKELIALLQKAVDTVEGNPEKMDEEAYRVETRRTAGQFDTQKEELTMLCMGLAGESGEVVDTIKKVVFHGHPLDLAELTKELGDTHWYFTRLMDTLGIDPAVVRQLNVEKLRKRFPNGFSSEDSIKRVDQ